MSNAMSETTDESFEENINPFLPVIMGLFTVLLSFHCRITFVIIIQIIGFESAKVSVQDAPDDVPYGLTDLTQAIRTTLHPLMVSLFRHSQFDYQDVF